MIQQFSPISEQKMKQLYNNTKTFSHTAIEQKITQRNSDFALPLKHIWLVKLINITMLLLSTRGNWKCKLLNKLVMP